MAEKETHCEWREAVAEYGHAISKGLQQFLRRNVRVAVITRERWHHSATWCYDPHDLLTELKPVFLRECFTESGCWRPKNDTIPLGSDFDLLIPPIPDDFVASARVVMVDALHGVTVATFVGDCSGVTTRGPIRSWLSRTGHFLAAEIVNRGDRFIAPVRANLSDAVRSYAPHAISHYLAEEGEIWHAQQRREHVERILEAVAELSKTTEEHRLPSGELVVMNERDWHSNGTLFALESPLPSLEEAKHAGKLLQSVQATPYCLACDEQLTVLGFAKAPALLPDGAIQIAFNNGRATISVFRNELETVAEVVRGTFYAPAGNVQVCLVEQAIQRLTPEHATGVAACVGAIVKDAAEKQHGCTLVIDFRENPLELAGHRLKLTIDLNSDDGREIAAAMSGVDGALHIDKNCRLRAFGCLLDGACAEGEDLARGARYNSALRFAKSGKNEGVVVVVVSADGYATVFTRDGELRLHAPLNPDAFSERLSSW